MIKCNELRIGNLLSDFEGNFLVVDALNKRSVVTNRGSVKKIGEVLNLESLKPIPIKEQLLLNLGIIIKDVRGFYYLGNNNTTGIYLTIDNELKKIIIFDAVLDSVNIEMPKYLHELQNLFFCLIGEELITLLPDKNP